MNTEKLTQKTIEALRGAQNAATENGNPSVEEEHLLYALLTGVFRQINFMGLGVQIDVCAERMTDTQLGVFCLVGALATLCAGYLLTALAAAICRAGSKLLRARYCRAGRCM